MTVHLDWRSGHWADTAAPCHLCRFPTYSRDDAGRPAHKVCVEAAIAKLNPDDEPDAAPICVRCGGPPDHPTTTHAPWPAPDEPF